MIRPVMPPSARPSFVDEQLREEFPAGVHHLKPYNPALIIKVQIHHSADVLRIDADRSSHASRDDVVGKVNVGLLGFLWTDSRLMSSPRDGLRFAVRCLMG